LLFIDHACQPVNLGGSFDTRAARDFSLNHSENNNINAFTFERGVGLCFEKTKGTVVAQNSCLPRAARSRFQFTLRPSDRNQGSALRTRSLRTTTRTFKTNARSNF
jgi:hypothetical protein